MNFILLIKIIEINIIVLFNIERGYDEACLNLVNHLLLTLRV